MLPLNMLMPAVKSDMASVFCGATTDAKVRTHEWMSWERELAECNCN